MPINEIVLDKPATPDTMVLKSFLLSVRKTEHTQRTAPDLKTPFFSEEEKQTNL
jgi:hypothetical protein